MVDFDNEQTVSTPPGDILKILIIQRWDYCIEAGLETELFLFKHGRIKEYAVKSGVRALFRSIINMLNNSIDNEEKLRGDLINQEFVDSLSGKVYSEEYAVVLKALETISDYLYMKQILKIDTRRSYDRKNIESMNRAKGL